MLCRDFQLNQLAVAAVLGNYVAVHHTGRWLVYFGIQFAP
jgi:hypothetical protein